MVGVFKSFGNTDTNGVIGRRGRVTLQTDAGGSTVRDVEFFHYTVIRRQVKRFAKLFASTYIPCDAPQFFCAEAEK